LLLVGFAFALAGLGDRGDEFGGTASGDYTLGRLALAVEFPVLEGTLVGRVKDWPLKEEVIHV
jgi:hypothetical protein